MTFKLSFPTFSSFHLFHKIFLNMYFSRTLWASYVFLSQGVGETGAGYQPPIPAAELESPPLRGAHPEHYSPSSPPIDVTGS